MCRKRWQYLSGCITEEEYQEEVELYLNMGFKITDLATDSKKEQEGIWIEHNGGKFKIAHSSNKKYREYLNRLLKPHRRAIQRGGDIPIEIMDEVTRKAASKYILLDWENIEDEAGKLIPYSPEKAYEFMLKHRKFYEIIDDYASNDDLFGIDSDIIDEDGVKN